MINNKNNGTVFNSGEELYLNYQNETVFISGGGAKITSCLVAGLIGIALGIILTALSGGFVIVYGLPLYGIASIIRYFTFKGMSISVSNLRITGKAVGKSNVNISLSQIRLVQIQNNGFLRIYYADSFGKQKKVIFPKMDNTEQIANAIYSLIAPPTLR